MYTILGKKKAVDYMMLRANDDAKAAKILEAKGFKIAAPEALN